jgi:adenine-specific DNA-methyltransferase
VQLIRSIRSLGPVLGNKTAKPAEVVGTALRMWCRRAYPKLRAPRLPWSNEIESTQPARTFVALLQRLPLLDAAYWLSTAYAVLSPEKYRRTLAMYFTPPPIAARMIGDLEREGARFHSDNFIDPACGGAAFLALIATRMRDALRKRELSARAILRHAEWHLAGTDIDRTLCVLSRHFLKMVFYDEICATRLRPDFRVQSADALRSYRRLAGRFNVVVCNPPFRKLSSDEVSKHRAAFSQVIQAQPNLYALFIGLTARLAKPGGLVGLVTPTSFLSGQYFASVRTFLLDHTRVRHIGIVSERDRVYLDVQQETALTIYRADERVRRGILRAAISVVERSGAYHRVGRCPLSNSGSSWPLARDSGDLALIESASKSEFRLEHYGYAPMIGGFVWTRDRRPAFLTLQDVPKARRATTVPLLWSSDIRPGGRLLFEKHAVRAAQHRYVDFGDLDHPTVRRRPGVLLQRVTCGNQARRLVGAVVSEEFIREHRGYVGENHVVILEQVAARPALSPRQLLKLLGALVVDRYFRSISGSANVSAFELGQLPLPDPAVLNRLQRKGTSIEQAAEKLLLGRSPSMEGRRIRA